MMKYLFFAYVYGMKTKKYIDFVFSKFKSKLLCFIFIFKSTGHHLPLKEPGFVVDQINPVEK